MNPQHKKDLLFVATIAIFGIIRLVPGPDEQRSSAVRLNPAAMQYARELIKQGRVVSDGKGCWKQHQLSAEQKNEFIRNYGFAEYAKWHLGIDDRHGENTKARYKFTYGDLENVHRCALLAAKSRAQEFHCPEIATAADQLLKELAVSSPTR